MPPGRMDHIMDKRTEPTVRGRTRTVEEWARWRGMTVETLVWRLEHGWEAPGAVFVPVRPAAAPAPGRMTRATEKKEPAMKTVGKAVYTIICLALLAATITAQSQGWTTTFYLAFLAVATPGATMWAWRHLMRA